MQLRRRRSFIFLVVCLLAIVSFAPFFAFFLVRGTNFTFVDGKQLLEDLQKKAYHNIITPDLNPILDITDNIGTVSSLELLHSPQYEITPTITCNDKVAQPRIELRGEQYWVMYNEIMASKVFHCNETITLTTHGDHNFMDNLFPLLDRWQGPVSVGVFAPGEDYGRAINAIMYQR
jgi:hypothetical protein